MSVAVEQTVRTVPEQNRQLPASVQSAPGHDLGPAMHQSRAIHRIRKRSDHLAATVGVKVPPCNLMTVTGELLF